MKVIVMVLATQIRFPENLVKIIQSGGSELKFPRGEVGWVGVGG